MPADIDLCNDALATIGEAPITALDQGTIPANNCQRFYASLRQAVLREGQWRFAKARTSLAQDAVAPNYYWVYSFTLPSDCLKVLPNDPTDRTSWAVEGRHLMMNSLPSVYYPQISPLPQTAYILYIKDVTDLNEWDAMAYQVFSARLASKLAAAIQRDMKRSQELLGLANALMLSALSTDGQEASPVPIGPDDLIRDR